MPGLKVRRSAKSCKYAHHASKILQASASRSSTLNATAVVFQPSSSSASPTSLSPPAPLGLPLREPNQQQQQQQQQQVDPCTLVLTSVPAAWKNAVFENICAEQAQPQRGICAALRSDPALGIWSCDYARVKGGEENTNTVFINFFREDETPLTRRLLLSMCPTLRIEQRRLQRITQRRSASQQQRLEWETWCRGGGVYLRAVECSSVPHWRIVEQQHVTVSPTESTHFAAPAPTSAPAPAPSASEQHWNNVIAALTAKAAEFTASAAARDCPRHPILEAARAAEREKQAAEAAELRSAAYHLLPTSLYFILSDDDDDDDDDNAAADY